MLLIGSLVATLAVPSNYMGECGIYPHAEHYNFRTMLCMDWDRIVTAEWWGGWDGGERLRFFCVNLLSGRNREASSFLFCSAHFTRVSFHPRLPCSSFHFPASPHYLSGPRLIISPCPPSYLSFNIPSLLPVCLSLSVTVYSEQITSYQTASRRWLMSLWVCVCVWEAWRASRLIFCQIFVFNLCC